MSSIRPSRILPRSTSTSDVKAASPTGGESDIDSNVHRVINGIRESIKQKVDDFYIDPRVLPAVLDVLRNSDAIDDRKMLLEAILTTLAKQSPSAAKSLMQNETVKFLYNDLSHPPATYIGPGYSYRTADGSGNNLSDPNMGKAETPYARSVQQTHAVPENQMPDPDLIFETLLKRDKFVAHPAGLSSMMFSFAALVIHTVFRTSHEAPHINETSSYVDLSPLYGHNADALNKIRMFDGRGFLKPDTFAEDRLLLLPPAVCTLLVLFNRNHNYIAQKLLEINERGTWKQDLEKASSQELKQQEEEIFGIARLCNCAWFGSAIFSDYFSSILGLVRLGSTWSLNPFGELRNADHSLFERGRGNVCSVEFNSLYRWHATTSQADEVWVTKMIDRMFDGKPADQISMDEFKGRLKAYQDKENPDPSHWLIDAEDNVQRQPDGSFKDSDLASYIKNATSRPAGAFKARGTPAVMQLHETMGIRANRYWGVCSMNDFRRFLNLKPYASFREWNSDPDIADAAEKLYGDIEKLELYPGLQAEEAKPVVPGAGLCPGYTISRAILSDAIALTRGDRFFTADYTPYNMTAWGFADCQRDADGPGNGSMLGRLLMRTLPSEFNENSCYAWFPLQTPESMEKFLGNQGKAAEYTYARPPSEVLPKVVLTKYVDVEKVLKTASKEFARPYGKKAARVLDGAGFFIATNDAERAERDQREFLRSLAPPDATENLRQFFYQQTRELIQKKSFSMTGAGRLNVDIVQDVLKFVPVHWVMTEILGIPLKTKDTQGVYTESEIYDKLADVYQYLFLDTDPSKTMRLEKRVKEHVAELKHLIKESIGGRTGSRFSIFGVFNTISSLMRPKPRKNVLAERLLANGGAEDEIVNNILALMVGATVELSQCAIHAVDMYFNPKTTSKPSTSATATSEDMMGFVYETMRLDPAFRGVYREALSNQTIGGQSIKTGQRVFLDLCAASLDEDTFHQPQTFNLRRSPTSRYLTGDGATRVLGADLAVQLVGSMLRGVIELNAKPAKANSGKLQRYRAAPAGPGPHLEFLCPSLTLRYEYLGKDQLPTPWPHGPYILQYNAPEVTTATNGTTAAVVAK